MRVKDFKRSDFVSDLRRGVTKQWKMAVLNKIGLGLFTARWAKHRRHRKSIIDSDRPASDPPQLENILTNFFRISPHNCIFTHEDTKIIQKSSFLKNYLIRKEVEQPYMWKIMPIS